MRLDKKYIIPAIAAVACGAFSACQDSLEALPLEYKENTNFAAPHINPEWNLEEISGMTEANVYAYKDEMYNALFTRTLGWNGGDVCSLSDCQADTCCGHSTTASTVWSMPKTAPAKNMQLSSNIIMVRTAEDGMPAGKRRESAVDG